MTRLRDFKQVDVFSDVPHRGNPLAVVLDSGDLDSAAMQRFANWTNLSETTFVLPAASPDADYLVRIFTPDVELPFAGHPTLGTCHAWLEAGGTPRTQGRVVQECAAGLVTIRRDTSGRLAFAAPPMVRTGTPSAGELEAACRVLRIDRDAVADASWIDNGPGWLGLQLADAAAVLALDPDLSAASEYKIGVVGLHPEDHPAAIEVRAFFRTGGAGAEDPVTGSLNASIAQWLLGNGTLTGPYLATQGAAIGRAGRVHIDPSDGEIWVGGDVVTCIDGTTRI